MQVASMAEDLVTGRPDLESGLDEAALGNIAAERQLANTLHARQVCMVAAGAQHSIAITQVTHSMV